ncbi:MAG: T9SS type A sorting domain-containing protein [candidate division WOR-3 bacterium]
MARKIMRNHFVSSNFQENWGGFFKNIFWASIISLSHLHLTQGTIYWTSIGPGGGGWFTAVEVSNFNSNIVFVGSDIGGIYKSTDGGKHWKVVNSGLIDYYITDIALHPVDSNIIYVATWSGVHKSTDGGEIWASKRNGFPPLSDTKHTAPIGTIAIAHNNPSVIYAGVGMPRVGGYNEESSPLWQKVPTKGSIFISTDDGESWIRRWNNGIDTSALIYKIAIDPTASEILYVAAHTNVYKSTDSGLSFFPINGGLPPMPDSSCPKDIAIDPILPQKIYLVLHSKSVSPRCGGVFFSTNGGDIWLPCTTGLGQTGNYQQLAINPSNSSVLYLSATTAGIYKTTNGGSTWGRVTRYPGESNSNVEMGWLRYWSGALALTISYSDTASVFYTSSGGVFKTESGGLFWEQCYSDSDTSVIGDYWKGRGLEITAIHDIKIDPCDSNIIYVALNDCGLLKSINRGYSFKQLTTPMWPDSGNTSFSIAISPHNPNIIFVGYGNWTWNRGQVWRSSDKGENWELSNSGLPSAQPYSILIDPTSPPDSLIIYVWLKNTGIYKSTNGGHTWEKKCQGLPFDLTREGGRNEMLAMDPFSPSTLYLCLVNYGVYKTTNGGNSWNLVLGTQFGEPRCIKINPLNPSSIFLSTRGYCGGLYKSSDGGNSWCNVFLISGYSEYISSIEISNYDTNYVVFGTLRFNERDSCIGLGVLLSTDGGWNFIPQNENGLTSRWIYSISFDPHNHNVLFLGTHGNGVYRGSLEENIEENKGFQCLLYPNIPNPFVSKTSIRYFLAKEQTISLQLFTVSGRLVKTLVKLSQKPGPYTIWWDGRDDNDEFVPAGVYFLKLKAGKFSATKKIVRLK